MSFWFTRNIDRSSNGVCNTGLCNSVVSVELCLLKPPLVADSAFVNLEEGIRDWFRALVSVISEGILFGFSCSITIRND